MWSTLIILRSKAPSCGCKTTMFLTYQSTVSRRTRPIRVLYWLVLPCWVGQCRTWISKDFFFFSYFGPVYVIWVCEWTRDYMDPWNGSFLGQQKIRDDEFSKKPLQSRATKGLTSKIRYQWKYQIFLHLKLFYEWWKAK